MLVVLVGSMYYVVGTISAGEVYVLLLWHAVGPSSSDNIQQMHCNFCKVILQLPFFLFFPFSTPLMLATAEIQIEQKNFPNSYTISEPQGFSKAENSSSEQI